MKHFLNIFIAFAKILHFIAGRTNITWDSVIIFQRNDIFLFLEPTLNFLP